MSVLRKLRYACVYALAMSAALTAHANAQANISDGVVRIGIMNDQAGPLSDPMGPGSVVAARLAVEDFLKKHPGLKVEVVVADHQNKPDVGATVARKWFDVDGVDMVADIGNSAVGIAIQQIAKEKNKVAIFSAVATTDLTGKFCSPSGFAWLHDSYNLVAGPIRSLVAQGDNTWFFIAADYAFGKNMVQESQRVLKEVNGKSLGVVSHPMDNTDYSSYLLQAQASGSKVVAFSNAGQQLVNSMKQWAEFGMNTGPQKPVAQLLFLTDVKSMGPEVAAGLTALTAWYWGLNDETKAFAERFNKVHGAKPTEAQAAVYSGVLHYLKAVAAANTDKTEAVVEKMRATPVEDFYAPGAKIREDGKLIHDFYLVEVKKPSEVKAPWDFYNVVRKVPASEAYIPLSESECYLVKK